MTAREVASIIESRRLASGLSRRALEARSGHTRKTLVNALAGRPVSYPALLEMLEVFNLTLTVKDLSE